MIIFFFFSPLLFSQLFGEGYPTDDVLIDLPRYPVGFLSFFVTTIAFFKGP